jgi:hypothetical protein
MPIEFPKDYYKLVEKENYLKHILYGDSVGKHSIIYCRFINDYQIKFLEVTIQELWFILKEKYVFSIKKENKEYIFLNDNNFEILNYDINSDSIYFSSPKYLMRHYYKGPMIKFFLEDDRTTITTLNHSYLNLEKNKLVKKNPDEIDHVLSLTYNKKRNLIKENIFKVKILKKIVKEYSGYVYDFENPDTHLFIINGILVHNTDSLFLTIPNKEQIEKDKKWDIISEHTRNINNLIIEKTNEIMTMQNLDSKYNKTNFKSEMLMSDICFLGKKTYCYKLENQEGVIVNPPKIKYKGIPVIKSDSSKFSQDLLKEMFENVVLNSDIKFNNKYEALLDLIKKFRNKFEEDINKYDFNYISIPTKWGKKENIINGMTIYNYIMNEEIFTPGSSGKYLYVNFFNHSKIKIEKKIDFLKHDILVVPFKYDINKLKDIMNQFNIQLNIEKQFDTIFVRAAEKLLDLTKSLNPI